MPDRPSEMAPVPDRLGSWKEIAAYLKTSVRSVQRWEKTEGLPTHRHVHDKRGSIYAYKSEIDHWWEGRRYRLKPEASSNERPRRGSLAVLLMMAVLGAGLGAGSVFLLTNRKQPPLPLRLSVLPPTGSFFQFGIQSGGHAVSPDGTQLAFVATTKGRQELWVRPLSAPAGHRLEGTEGSYYPFWSPDSRSIAFFAGGKLKRVDVSGGATQIVDSNVYGRGGAWGDDSTILFADFPSLDRAGIFQISASGGRPARLTSIDASRGENLHEWPCLLPDGRFLYFIRSDRQEESGIYLGWRDSARNPHRTRILSTRSNAFYSREGSHSGSLFWVRDGALLAQRLNLRTLELKGQPVPVAQDVGLESVIGLAHASVSPAGVLSYDAAGREPTQLTWFDRSGKVLGTVGGPGSDHSPRISPDGKFVLVARVDDSSASSDIWWIDLSRNAAGRATALPSFRGFLGPVWSPDGKEVAFGLRLGFFRKRIDSDQLERLLPTGNFGFPDDWSSDGRYLLYRSLSPETQYDLWILPLTTPNAKPQPLIQSRFNEDQGQFSIDMKWVAYSSDESGRREVYVRGFRPVGQTMDQPGRRWLISSEDGECPRWRADGRELFYRGADGMLMSVPVTSAAEFSFGSARPLFSVPVSSRFPSAYTYDVAPDGQRFLVAVPMERAAGAAITILTNWQSITK